MKEMLENAILLQDLHFLWPGETEDCLHLPQLSISKGERVFLHGPSGSGKSTLLGLLSGILMPYQGKITLMQQDMSHLSGNARDSFRADHIGIIFQQFNLVPYLSVIDNVLLTCHFSAYRKNRTIQSGGSWQTATELLQQLAIPSSLWQRQAMTLSTGQQQRVAMARALIGAPEIIIADEPTSALDAERQDAFLELLLGHCLNTETTLVFVSHDHRLASLFNRNIPLSQYNLAHSQEAASC